MRIGLFANPGGQPFCVATLTRHDPQIARVLIACFVAGAIVRRFPSDERAARVLILGAVSLGISIIGAMLGELWSILIEMVRLGNGHLSYRTQRIPWVQHRVLLFASSLVLFWLTAAFRCGIRGRDNPGSRFRTSTGKSLLMLDD